MDIEFVEIKDFGETEAYWARRGSDILGVVIVSTVWAHFCWSDGDSEFCLKAEFAPNPETGLEPVVVERKFTGVVVNSEYELLKELCDKLEKEI